MCFATWPSAWWAQWYKDEPDDIKSQIIGTWDATAVKTSGHDWTDITDYPSLALSITFNKIGRSTRLNSSHLA